VDTTVLLIFIFVYAGMILGRIPGLALDRTGVALLGAIGLLAFDRVTPQDAWDAIDVSTIALLFGLMVVSAQFRLGGAYSRIVQKLAQSRLSPQAMLAVLIGVSAVLSAILANDIVVLAMTPMLVVGCRHKGLDPVPYLLALACSANIGSAATLIGNPQNMLIGQRLHLPFAGYMLQAFVPVIVGLGVIWIVIVLQRRGDWKRPPHAMLTEVQPFDSWQTTKGVLITAALMGVFLFTDWPRDILAMAAAGLMLTSRQMASRRMLGFVDWQLLVLFVGLFIVNHALASSGILATMMTAVAQSGIDLHHPPILLSAAIVLSNLVSNVPSTMLLLPMATHPLAGAVLALGSTLAGNLLIVGSIANIIVVEQASAMGVKMSWKTHARVGVPVTLISLAFAAFWLWLIS
jgi:Na+/H+ antiporter NhaD/arsenite permease-like protein